MPVGLLVGLPALRTRGVNLAIATLGLALLIERVVLGNADYTGGFEGTVVPPPDFLGIDLDPITYPRRLLGVLPDRSSRSPPSPWPTSGAVAAGGG